MIESHFSGFSSVKDMMMMMMMMRIFSPGGHHEQPVAMTYDLSREIEITFRLLQYTV